MDAKPDFYTVSSIIAGRSTPGSRSSELYNPATGEVIGALSLGDKSAADAAVAAASKAFPAWKERGPSQRSRILMRFRELAEMRKVDLAQIITHEHGKPEVDALGSIQRGLEVVEFAMGAPHLLKGENSDHVGTGVSTRSSRRPLGVCVGITPFNYPAMIPMWMFPLALACGNTFVLKPSEKTPSAANFLAELLQEAGLPDGVFNVVHGGSDVASALIEHPDVKAVSFVGSSAVARSVYHKGTAAGKRVQALGGAKNHAIVMPDADMPNAVSAILNGAFNSAGQRCMAIAVVVAVDDAHEKLMPELVQKAAEMKVAAGSDADCEVPPVTSRQQYEKIVAAVDSGVTDGAKLLLDRRDPQANRDGKGYFIGPIIFDDVGREMQIYQNEIFGPVLAVMKAATLEEAIAISNSHELGNGAVLFTNSGKAAQIFERDILCGMPGVNVPVPSPVAYYSFGGNRGSLFGDLAAHGPDGINFYTRRQVLTSRWP
ncbi:CoA-acylating methylmalonate-semialdehyde dehydrogenase [Acidisoma cellulosilytica]|uniref:methylmalonate-semialdehyde dehydrogenase (CoA acylating) n=1 Tax=Acidisoma cellulosilyticum TaxID=2802395 RepID=A0A963Z534_9PROT|nr:CoA-acylating methylmalonate-semialdehyde dehydrogenase [Acidisoma cellulosilyticum]MCB8882789.1 CoA-acylating methylmalonate-semialdehyde dehydrogenase [Acidisoma cellulosilyticum]